jgi:hypothetical protein
MMIVSLKSEISMKWQRRWFPPHFVVKHRCKTVTDSLISSRSQVFFVAVWCAVIHYAQMLMGVKIELHHGIMPNQDSKTGLGVEIMSRWTHNDWTVLSSSAVAIGTQLVVTANAVAHEGHPHRQDAEAASPPTDEQPTTDAEAASEPSATTHTESVNTPATEMPMETPESPIEATSETPTAPAAVSQARITEGFSIGFGESLLGLIIAGPFLLLTLKKQLQS